MADRTLRDSHIDVSEEGPIDWSAWEADNGLSDLDAILAGFPATPPRDNGVISTTDGGSAIPMYVTSSSPFTSAECTTPATVASADGERPAADEDPSILELLKPEYWPDSLLDFEFNLDGVQFAGSGDLSLLDPGEMPLQLPSGPNSSSTTPAQSTPGNPSLPPPQESVVETRERGTSSKRKRTAKTAGTAATAKRKVRKETTQADTSGSSAAAVPGKQEIISVSTAPSSDGHPVLILTPDRQFVRAIPGEDDSIKPVNEGVEEIGLVFDYRTTTISFKTGYLPKSWGNTQVAKPLPSCVTYDGADHRLKINYDYGGEGSQARKGAKVGNAKKKALVLQIYQGTITKKFHMCNISLLFKRQQGVAKESTSLAIKLNKDAGNEVWVAVRSRKSLESGGKFGSLETKPFYHPTFDREKSESILLDKRPFTFLVRPSKTTKDKVVVVMTRPHSHPPALRHHLVSYNIQTKKWLFDKNLLFNSLDEFIKCWKKVWNTNHPEALCQDVYYVDRITLNTITFGGDERADSYLSGFASYAVLKGSNKSSDDDVRRVEDGYENDDMEMDVHNNPYISHLPLPKEEGSQ